MKLILKAGVCLMSVAFLMAAPIQNTQESSNQELDNVALIAPKYAKGQTKDEAYSVSELTTAMSSLGEGKFYGSSIYVKGKIGSTPKLSSKRYSFDLTDPVTKDYVSVSNLQSIRDKSDFKKGDLSYGDEVIITGDVQKTGTGFKVCYNQANNVRCHLVERILPKKSVSDVVKTSAKDDSVNVFGIISDVQDSQGIFLQDKTTTDGLLCYKQKLPKGFKIGDEVLVSGKVSSYNGAKQLKETQILSDAPISSNNTIKYEEISNVADFENLNSALVTVKGATLTSNSFDSSEYIDKETHMDVNGQDLILFCKKDDESYATAANEIFKNDHKGMTVYDISGVSAIYSRDNFVKHQILLTDNIKITVNAYESLIKTLMGEDVENQCKTKFSIAKDYYFKCDEATQEAFRNGEKNLEAKQRYEAWAVALGEQAYVNNATSGSHGLTISQENITIAIVTIAIIAISAIAVFGIVKYKKSRA